MSSIRARYLKRTSKDTDDFETLEEESLKDNTADLIDKRMEFVSRNTWDRRAEETYEVPRGNDRFPAVETGEMTSQILRKKGS